MEKEMMEAMVSSAAAMVVAAEPAKQEATNPSVTAAMVATAS
jgi:hypothetical protein